MARLEITPAITPISRVVSQDSLCNRFVPGDTQLIGCISYRLRLENRRRQSEARERGALERDKPAGRAAGSGQTGAVELHRFFFFQCSEGLAQDLCRACMGRHGDAIVHPFALAARGYDACTAEIGEVARDFWLRAGQDFNEIAHTYLLIAHEVEQAETGLVAQGLEEAFEIELRP